MTTPIDIEQRLAEVEAREREVERRERAASAAGLRHNLYSRINCSVRTLDIVIIACLIAIVVLTVVGVGTGGR